ncbi:unnamed protein product [Rhizophagus irregularis]|nr:unnamed protein product [Rhizophagus irregularis]
MVNKRKYDSDSSFSDSGKPITEQAFITNALRASGSTQFTSLQSLKKNSANMEIDHFIGPGDVSRLITAGKRNLKKVSADDLYKISNYLNYKYNCFKIVKELNRKKGQIKMEDYHEHNYSQTSIYRYCCFGEKASVYRIIGL